MQRTLRCFARGNDGRFEAICIDLDISIEARTLPDAQRCLNDAIGEYVRAAVMEDPKVARKLLSRRSPWHVRMGWIWSFSVHMLLHSEKHERSMQASYDLPCPA